MTTTPRISHAAVTIRSQALRAAVQTLAAVSTVHIGLSKAEMRTLIAEQIASAARDRDKGHGAYAKLTEAHAHFLQTILEHGVQGQP